MLSGGLAVVLDFTVFMPAMKQLDPARQIQLDTLTKNACLSELCQELLQGGITSTELTVFYLERIRRFDRSLHSVMELNPDALKEAERLDSLLLSGTPNAARLHGVPLLVKDNVGTGDRMHNTAGAAVLAGHRTPRAAELVRQLREAGAVILGKTNMSEWAFFMSSDAPSGYSTLGGQVINPYGANLEVRGSSTGSAVAVAARFAAATIGTETNGSIIAPASALGICGMRPTPGLVSTDMIIPVCAALDGAGPMARQVDDLGLLLSVMSGDAFTWQGHDDTRPERLLQGLRIGVVSIGDPVIDDPAYRLLATASEALVSAGACIGQSVVPRGNHQFLADRQLQLLVDSMATDLSDYLCLSEAPIRCIDEVIAYNEQSPALYAAHGQDLLIKARDSGSANGQPGALASEVHDSAMATLRDITEHGAFDILLTLDHEFSLVYASAGVPAVTVPMGRDRSGQPRGATFVGIEPGSDAFVLSVARVFEQIGSISDVPDLQDGQAY